jgi:hypothetical protein
VALFDRIMSALDWQIPMWKTRSARFTPLAVTYLQESQWRDDPPVDGVDESDEAFDRVMAGRGRLQ